MASGLVTILLLVTHIVTASLWIGNAFFLELIVNPSLKTLTLGHARELAMKTGNQATILAWGSIIITATTGLIIAILLGQLNTAFMGSPIGLFLTVSVILTVSAVANSCVITFIAMPRTRNENSQIANRSIEMVSVLIRLNTAFALATTVSMVILRGP